ncbi:hypothetical protein PHYPSEUDO_011524 [Phytophthora pseudosyringae]|uniref:Peptidase A1 domain-containing protein n=1 Tax=Phytophthora pseudosyringae TaxID=221518 RepID=A0A8T1V8Z7_9STRA|nr:hypothetical protein PHYPSEUDO_011524 [Phytophthora pseudosyringae]
MARVLCRLAVLLLSTQELTAVRSPLGTKDHLRFTGAVHVGSPHRSVRVVFDTGSSDTWVASDQLASGAPRAGNAFAIGYGGGTVSGTAAPRDLQLGYEAGSGTDGLLLRDVPVGFVDDPTAVIPAELGAQGVVGLGMEALAQIHGNSSLWGLLAKQQDATEPLAFSLYVSGWSGAQPASQLVLGGVNPALTSTNATWRSFPVISNSALRHPRPPSRPTSTCTAAQDSFGFWALRVQRLSFDGVTLPLGTPNNSNGAALLDSGASVLLLPQHAFDSVVQALVARFGTRLLPFPNDKPAPPACRPCQVHEFPSLVFDLVIEDSTESDATSQRVELRGSDYVRCDQRRRECTAMIDSIHSPEISDHLDVLVLGTVFFRAYYTHFDYSNKQVSLACTLANNGSVCLGGLQPALDYRGQPYEPYSEIQQPRRSWEGLCAAVTALALLATLRTLLQPYESAAPSSSYRTRQPT